MFSSLTGRDSVFESHIIWLACNLNFLKDSNYDFTHYLKVFHCWEEYDVLFNLFVSYVVAELPLSYIIFPSNYF